MKDCVVLLFIVECRPLLTASVEELTRLCLGLGFPSATHIYGKVLADSHPSGGINGSVRC